MKRPDGFICYFHFVGWDCISLGFHICFGAPNVEIHLPFGFIRIGWRGKPVQGIIRSWDGTQIAGPRIRRTFGLGA